jgi:multidrug efflux pump subunit AcrA (membrane-fusion protein)
MRSKKNILVAVAIILAAVLMGGIIIRQRVAAQSGEMILSGTIEATEINLPTIQGGKVIQVVVSEGDQIQKGQTLVRVTHEIITSPLNGVVLERLVEPDEYAAPGSTVLVVASLDALTLKVFMPEDRYGQIALGQVCLVTVDSFPGQAFRARVVSIASQAEFTPRNVQTTDSRKTTVYAVKLALDPSGGKLKPGMPADAHLGALVQ